MTRKHKLFIITCNWRKSFVTSIYCFGKIVFFLPNIHCQNTNRHEGEGKQNISGAFREHCNNCLFRNMLKSFINYNMVHMTLYQIPKIFLDTNSFDNCKRTAQKYV